MAISTHRLIVLYFVIAVLIGIAATIHSQPRIYIDEDIGKTGEIGNDYLEEFEDESTQKIVYTTESQEEKSRGNPLKYGALIGNVVITGLIPYPLGIDRYNGIEKMIMRMIKWFQALLLIIMIIDQLMVWKNKKQS